MVSTRLYMKQLPKSLFLEIRSLYRFSCPKEKSQYIALGKITFLESHYEIVYIEGGMYGLGRLYFHLVKKWKQVILMGTPFIGA